MSRVDYGLNQWSFVSLVIKKLYVYLFMVKQCIYLYSCTSCKHIFTFYDLVIHLQILSYFWIICRLYTQRELSRKAKFWEDSKSQVRLSLKTNDISLTISRNLLYFNFTKSR